LVQILEKNGPLINFEKGGVMVGYMKDFQKDEKQVDQSMTAHTPEVFDEDS